MNPYPETLPREEDPWNDVVRLVFLLSGGAFYSACLFFAIWTLWRIV